VLITTLITAIVSVLVEALFAPVRKLIGSDNTEAKREHLNQIKHDLVEPLLNALKSRGEITQTDDMILVYSDGRSVDIPLTFFENVKRYHFPKLCILDEYLSVQRKLQDVKREIDERLKFLLKRIIADALKDSPIRQGFQTCPLDIDFELALEKAVYDFLRSNLHRLDKWDWRRDFKSSFRVNSSSGPLEIQFNQYIIYKELVLGNSTVENRVMQVRNLVYSILAHMVENGTIKSLAMSLTEELTRLERQRFKKLKELKAILEEIKYTQKLPLKKRKWGIIKESCPCLRDH